MARPLASAATVLAKTIIVNAIQTASFAVRAANVFGVGNFDSLYTQIGTDLMHPVSFSILFVPIPHSTLFPPLCPDSSFHAQVYSPRI